MSPKVKKSLKIVVPIVVVLAAIVWFVLWANAPKQGTITNGSSSNKGPTTYYDKKLDGTYMSFQYSGKYVAKTETPTNGDVERYTLSADTRYDKRISASVSDLPDGQLTSNGNYIFRQKSTTLYTNRKVQVAGSTADVWVKKDGTEQTAIFAHGAKAATISFVTANTNDDLTSEIDALLKTFSWKQ